MDAVRSVEVGEAFQHAPIAAGVLDAEGRLLRANGALGALLDGPAGAGVEELIDRHAPRVLQRGRRTWRAERRVRSGREWLWMELRVARLPESGGAVVQLVDVTAARERAAELQRLAERESLTGLWNRRRFDQELVRQLARCRRHGDSAILVVVDVDGLKAVNDRLGHKGGDDVIIHVARQLTTRVRASDAVARIGGDEFAVLLVHTPAAAAPAAVEGLCAAVAERPALAAGRLVDVSISAGHAILDAATADPDETFVAADASLYAAKARARTRRG